ncbi:MAG: hypothetical protein MR711_13035 [Selenomonas sp.]|uniref:hypothetical protein n=1 Tax=Selenomonas sp. TaxID=2053611 RepID=UPI0025D7B3C8|nr:hypothetical protein [Selenomonas sp.]MCI6087142.1 hypothetical protein [Selenomonas sp.]MDY4417459.1 hypothetical protein [Selenomonas sp.]
MDESSRSVIVPKTLPIESTTFNSDNSSFAIGPNPTINNIETRVVVLPSSAGHQQNPLPSEPMNHSCYNLIVLEEEFLRRDYVTIPNELVFNESISPQLQKRFCRLDASAQAELRSFPCIFASPNRHGSKTDANHKAHFGIIKGIDKREQSVKISYSLIFDIQQQQLNQIVSDLQIRHSDLSNEFDTPHWTVKEANLLSVFHRNNIPCLF